MVQNDPQPELQGKVPISIDLGNSARGTEYDCIVQIYGRSSEVNDFVLVQTNPQREVQAKLFGSPDLNQPESLGYFPTHGGMANVYFVGDGLAGYMDLEQVIQCSSNSSKLVYENAISTRYSPVGRSLVGRGVWLTSGNNAIFLIIGVVMAVIAVLLLAKAARTWGLLR